MVEPIVTVLQLEDATGTLEPNVLSFSLPLCMRAGFRPSTNMEIVAFSNLVLTTSSKILYTPVQLVSCVIKAYPAQVM